MACTFGASVGLVGEDFGRRFLMLWLLHSSVGVQFIGGEDLSGPKAGGPALLLALCAEQTLAIDTAGGNAAPLAGA